MTRHPDEGTLHAFIDGELPRAEAAELELHVAACSQCASALAEARGLTAAASRVVNALDGALTSASRTAPPVRAVAARVKRPSYFRAPYLQAAAVLLLAAGSAIVIDRTRSPGESIAADMVREADASAAAPVTDEAEVPATQSPEQALTRPAPAVPRIAVGASATEKTSVQRAPNRGKGSVGAANMSQPTASEAVSAMAPQRVDAAADRMEAATVTGQVAALPPPLAEAVPASSASLTSTIRYRLESGVVLTLVDEPLDSAEARQRIAATRRLAPTGASAGSAMAALSAGPVAGNSYRWVDTQRRRAYVLSGPVTEEILKSAASRLGELQRVP